MFCPGLEDAVAPAVTAELLGAPELDAAGAYCEALWNRWCPPPSCCEYAFPYIGATRASPKKVTHVFIVL